MKMDSLYESNRIIGNKLAKFNTDDKKKNYASALKGDTHPCDCKVEKTAAKMKTHETKHKNYSRGPYK